MRADAVIIACGDADLGELASDAQLAMLIVTCAVGTNSWLVSASGSID